MVWFVLLMYVQGVELSSVPWPIVSLGGHEGRFSRDRLPVFSSGGHCEQFWHGQGRPLWRCPSSISSADHDVAHALRFPEGWFWRGCRGAWHAQIMEVSVSWQLPEDCGPTRVLISISMCMHADTDITGLSYGLVLAHTVRSQSNILYV